MNKILIPTDGSELANFAYGLAHKISAKTGAEIHTLSIIPAPANAVFDREGNIKEDEGEDLSELRKVEQVKLKDLNDWKKDKPDVAQVKTKIGRVENDILSYIDKESIDLVVMGTKGASGLQEFLHGSHTAHIIRESKIPVLSLKCDRSTYEVSDILLVSDFHEKVKIDLEMVTTLQEVFGAKLHLLKINTPSKFETHKEIEENMLRFEATQNLSNTEHHIYCDHSMEEGISHFSADTGMDFIVLETNQKSGLGRLIRHSISEELVNHLWQPILSIKI